MTRIKLTQEADIEGYEDAFLHYVDEKGRTQPYGIWDYWFTAKAVDNDGNEYTVFWETKEDFDLSNPADEACDWESPYMVIDENGVNVLNSVELI